MTKNKTHLWLIRVYALIVAIVVITRPFEGSTFDIIVLIATIAIILQSFFLGKSDTNNN